MLSGMFLAEAAMPAFNAVAARGSAVVDMLWLMVLGMTAGMWVGWWSAALVGRIYRRASSGTDIVAARG